MAKPLFTQSLMSFLISSLSSWFSEEDDIDSGMSYRKSAHNAFASEMYLITMFLLHSHLVRTISARSAMHTPYRPSSSPAPTNPASEQLPGHHQQLRFFIHSSIQEINTMLLNASIHYFQYMQHKYSLKYSAVLMLSRVTLWSQRAIEDIISVILCIKTVLSKLNQFSLVVCVAVVKRISRITCAVR